MRYLHTMDARRVDELLADYIPEEPIIRVTFYRYSADKAPEKVVLDVCTNDIHEAYECAIVNGHDPSKNIRFQTL